MGNIHETEAACPFCGREKLITTTRDSEEEVVICTWCGFEEPAQGE